MKKQLFSILSAILLLTFFNLSYGQSPNLGTASSFALFTANGALSNGGTSVVTGDIGTNAGAFTGFASATVIGQTRLPGSTQADQAATDVLAAYNALTPVACGTLISPILGNGQILTAGVYCQNTAAASSLNGTLTLSGPGLFIIKLSSAFAVNPGAIISLTNGACLDNVYFHVNGAVGLGTGSVFKGTILANGAISLAEGASLEGRALSTSGAIALSNNRVTNVPSSCTTASASLGGTVYSDNNTNNVRDGGDSPIAGVVVSLRDGSNSPIASTTTNALGVYSFTGLTSGVPYSVSTTMPTGFSTSSTGVTGPVTLTSGENNTSTDVGYYALPTPLTLVVLVDRSVVQLGSTLSYTIVVTNSGTTTRTNVVVRDSTTTGLTYVPNSAAVPVGTMFTSGAPISSWSIAAIGAGQSLSLTFQAVADSSGILYNIVSVPGSMATACVTIPVKMCAGDEFTLTVPAGRSNYSWYKDGVLITGQTSNTLVVREPGSYSLGVDTVGGLCPNFSCCPFIVELDADPVYQVAAIGATCRGTIPQSNGQIILTNVNPTHTYQYSLGTTFNPAASLSGVAKTIPANGVLTTTLPNPEVVQSYTVRVRNASGCYTDMTVTVSPTSCDCSAEICIPVVIQKTKLLPKRN